jgi:phage-related protein
LVILSKRFVNFRKARVAKRDFRLRGFSAAWIHHWKPMPSIGPGVREIRITDPGGAFRVIYTTLVGDAVYVLHAFQKKSQSTPRRDLARAAARYAQLKRSRP